MSGWSLVVTAPHRERAVARMLTAFGIDHHLFQELRQQVWRGRVVLKPRPAFPGYVFCAPGYWERVRSICGVVGFLSFGERHAVIDRATVDQLVAASVDDVFPLRVAPTSSRFRPGDRVNVQGDSVWFGQVGTFQRMLADTQALVEFECMGRSIAIPIDERSLELDLAAPQRRRRRRRRGSGNSSRVALSSAIAA